MLGVRYRFSLAALAAFAFLLVLPTGVCAQNSAPLFYDFDGDGRLDRVELFSGGVHNSIELKLSSSPRTRLSFDSAANDRGILLAMDIDRDRELDLVWLSPAQPRAIVVWLGDGHGHFRAERDSSKYLAQLAFVLGVGAGESLSSAAPERKGACASGSSFCLEAGQRKFRAQAPRPAPARKLFPVLTSDLMAFEGRGPPQAPAA